MKERNALCRPLPMPTQPANSAFGIGGNIIRLERVCEQTGDCHFTMDGRITVEMDVHSGVQMIDAGVEAGALPHDHPAVTAVVMAAAQKIARSSVRSPGFKITGN